MGGESVSFVDNDALLRSTSHFKCLERWETFVHMVRGLMGSIGVPRQQWPVRPSRVAELLLLARLRGQWIFAQLPQDSGVETMIFDFLFFRTEKRKSIELYSEKPLLAVGHRFQDPSCFGGADVSLCAILPGAIEATSLKWFALPSSLRLLQAVHLCDALRCATPEEDAGTLLINTFQLLFPGVFHAVHVHDLSDYPIKFSHSEPGETWIRANSGIVSMFPGVLEDFREAKAAQARRDCLEREAELSRFTIDCHRHLQEVRSANGFAATGFDDVLQAQREIVMDAAENFGLECLLVGGEVDDFWSMGGVIAWKAPDRDLFHSPKVINDELDNDIAELSGTNFALSALEALVNLAIACEGRVVFPQQLQPYQRQIVSELAECLELCTLSSPSRRIRVCKH